MIALIPPRTLFSCGRASADSVAMSKAVFAPWIIVLPSLICWCGLDNGRSTISGSILGVVATAPSPRDDLVVELKESMGLAKAGCFVLPFWTFSASSSRNGSATEVGLMEVEEITIDPVTEAGLSA